jgi:hypothetical protein
MEPSMKFFSQLKLLVGAVQGITTDCQSLDRGIFRNRKSLARAKFTRFPAQNQNPTVQDSIGMLLQTWKSISQFEVLDA